MFTRNFAFTNAHDPRYACEQDRTSPCIFNVTADECEQIDISGTLPAADVAALLARLAKFQASSVSTDAALNPDGPGKCPYVATVGGVKVWMPCDNNGSHPPAPAPEPGPGPTPPSPPPPTDAFELEREAQCLHDDLTLGACNPAAASRIWYSEKDGSVDKVIKTTGSCLKIFESSSSSNDESSASNARIGASAAGRVGDCAQWHALHVGVCRQDNNTFSLVGGELVSALCEGACAVAQAGGHVALGACKSADATGWTSGARRYVL